MAVVINLTDPNLTDLSMLATILGETWQDLQETLNEYYAQSVPQALDFARDVVVNATGVVDIGRWPWHFPRGYSDIRFITWATPSGTGDLEVTLTDGSTTITNVHAAGGGITEVSQTMIMGGGANNLSVTAEQLVSGAGTLHLVLIETVDIAAGVIPA